MVKKSSTRLALLLALVLLASPIRAEVELFEELTLEQALARAAVEEKIVLIDYFTTWCVPCKKMDASTWIDPEVIRWVEANAVAVRFDAEIEVEQAKGHGISTFPTTLLLAADGRELDRLTGFKSTDELLSEIAAALQGKDAVARAHEQWQEDPKNLSLRLGYARALVEGGRLEEALAEFLACWDAPVAENPEFAGVRGSFLLGDILRLARRHPPARAALESRRKQLELEILGGGLEPTARGSEADDPAVWSLVFGYQRLGESLDGDSHRALELLDRVAAQGPRLEQTHRQLARSLRQPLLEERRYALLLAAENPEESFRQELERMNGYLDSLDDSMSGPMREHAVDGILEHVLAQGLDAVEILVGVGERERALALADQVAESAGSAELWSQLADRARRAGDDATADVLAGRTGHETEPATHEDSTPEGIQTDE